METINIASVMLNDLAALQEISRQTFTEAFSENNNKEDMVKYLNDSFSLEKLETELGNTASQFYFALLDGAVIGYLKLNTGVAQTELHNSNSLEIERIYVLSAYYGKKVGQLLYDKAIEVATALKSDFVWLGVWEENLRAIRFYGKNGFVAFDKHIFKLGEDEQTDIMMKKVLDSFAK